jgi:NADPH:quinone reductase-like Zn-dependent oxidoreductase
MATSIPKTMSGVLVEKTGGVEVLQYKTDLPVPTPKEGQILVKNDFIGINYIDTYSSLSLPLLALFSVLQFSGFLTSSPQS